jgi:hypothetical protein
VFFGAMIISSYDITDKYGYFGIRPNKDMSPAGQANPGDDNDDDDDETQSGGWVAVITGR